MDVIKYYKQHAEALAGQYDALHPDDVHKCLKKLLSNQEPGLACDIGAGTGRDANWLAKQGWDVIAVEPCKELRKASENPSHPNVIWLDDKLPELKKLRTAGHRFNLILLSAVWMHIPEKQRQRAFRILTDLLAPNGLLVISLRYGKNKKENQQRGFHEVSAEQLEYFAKERAVAVTQRCQSADQGARKEVSWETIVIKLPDDGTGSLPLLRHIIVNDDKASTYKLGLLRTLVRIAEGAPGMVVKRTDTEVTIPFGLVGLYWLKLYMQLVLSKNLIQTPTANHEEAKGYGWAKTDFWSLRDLSPYDLRVGSVFSPDQAIRLRRAIKDACINIQKMPANFITYPGLDKQVFSCSRNRYTVSNKHWQINKETLAEFGTFTIPSELWQTLGQYACWIEPAIVNEWSNVIQSYYKLRYKPVDCTDGLEWEEGKRDTTEVRRRIASMQEQGSSIQCVWSQKKIRKDLYDVDHCFPWSAWLNNDLWNLMPANKKINIQKGNKLPSAVLMGNSKSRILEWWEQAYIESEFNERFYLEAEAALPLIQTGNKSLHMIFDAVLHQRARLKANQQLVEWGI